MAGIDPRALDRELKRGSAELLILSLLDARPRHGYELSKLIHTRSEGQLTFHIDSLYPLLYRLEERGWIKGTWVEKPDERRRRFYKVTAEGRHELSQHLEDRYRELIAGGTSPDEATRLALADFQSGNILGQKMASLRQGHVTAPTTLGAPTGHVVSDLWQDVRYAARIFWKLPAFAATAVLTLALGIGATTAIFSVVYGVLLKPLPFHEADRLVSLRQHAPHGAGTVHGPATYLTYRENQQAFEAIGAWDPAEVSITGGGDPERVQALLVSSSTLPLLRVQPVVGRVFSTEDDTPGHPLRVVLTYGYWQRRFGGVENIVGQT